MNHLIVSHLSENVRDRVSLLIPPMDLSKFPKYFVWEFLLHRGINIEGVPPTKCGYEHVLCFRHVEVPGIGSYRSEL